MEHAGGAEPPLRSWPVSTVKGSQCPHGSWMCGAGSEMPPLPWLLERLGYGSQWCGGRGGRSTEELGCLLAGSFLGPTVSAPLPLGVAYRGSHGAEGLFPQGVERPVLEI